MMYSDSYRNGYCRWQKLSAHAEGRALTEQFTGGFEGRRFWAAVK